MFNIIVEKECGCFKKSDMENNVKFNDKEQAMNKANEMVENMNTTFCRKHNFYIEENDNNIIIKMENNS